MVLIKKIKRIAWVTALIITGHLYATAQITEVSAKKRSQPSERHFQLKIDSTTWISVSIINPRGEIQVKPIPKQVLLAESVADFSFNIRSWIPGVYYIVAENDVGVLFATRMKIGKAGL